MNAQQTVLVIDDETATLTMFRLFLTAYGYTTLTAENGETGLQLVRDHRPGIVFTDLKMPGMDGFAVLREIKKRSPATEVIVITGHGDMDHVVRALNLGAADFINKPIGRSNLDAALKRAEACLEADSQDTGSIDGEVASGLGIIHIRGTLASEHNALLATVLENLLEAGAEGIVIRFARHAGLDGGGIALLTRLLSKARAADRPVRIAGLSENFKMLFDMLGITRSAPCIDSLADFEH
jgi:YesN/AraC family two-component response regulator